MTEQPEVTSPPTDEAVGVREMHVRHPDGHVFRIGRAIGASGRPQFADGSLKSGPAISPAHAVHFTLRPITGTSRLLAADSKMSPAPYATQPPLAARIAPSPRRRAINAVTYAATLGGHQAATPAFATERACRASPTGRVSELL